MTRRKSLHSRRNLLQPPKDNVIHVLFLTALITIFTLVYEEMRLENPSGESNFDSALTHTYNAVGFMIQGQRVQWFLQIFFYIYVIFVQSSVWQQRQRNQMSGEG